MAKRDEYDDSASESDPRRAEDGDDEASRQWHQPRKSWRERFFSNRVARTVATSAPYSITGDESALGSLAQAADEFGWRVIDHDEQADTLLDSAMFRHAGYRAGHVVHGRFDPFADRRGEGLPTGEWSLIAFDAVEDSRLGRTVGHCVTAVPTMIELPRLRVLPARFSTAGSQSMLVYPTVDPIFDARFKLLAPNGDRELEVLTELITDDVRMQLCDGPDLDEVWTAHNHLLVATAGPHDETTLARHLAILTQMLRALRASL